MKIFKHRGDIYVSKSGYKSSREERILLIILAFIVAITVAFLVALNNKYDSFSDFIAGDDVTVSESYKDDSIALPQIEGKRNFIVFETDDEESIIHFAYLIQMDGDNMSYKVCTLSPNMTIDGESLYDIFLLGGGALVQSRLTSFLGIDIDYYIDFEYSDFVEFVNSLGNVIYPMPSAIKHNGGAEGDHYAIRVSEGEQSLSGKDNINLMRYFSNEKVNLATCNELVLYSLTQLFSEENYNRCDSLFRLFISNASTNITVRDFENGRDSIMVFCYKNNDLTVYSCNASFKKNQLTAESMQEIKGYFNK